MIRVLVTDNGRNICVDKHEKLILIKMSRMNPSQFEPNESTTISQSMKSMYRLRGTVVRVTDDGASFVHWWQGRLTLTAGSKENNVTEKRNTEVRSC